MKYAYLEHATLSHSAPSKALTFNAHRRQRICPSFFLILVIVLIPALDVVVVTGSSLRIDEIINIKQDTCGHLLTLTILPGGHSVPISTPFCLRQCYAAFRHTQHLLRRLKITILSIMNKANVQQN